MSLVHWQSAIQNPYDICQKVSDLLHKLESIIGVAIHYNDFDYNQ